MIETAGAALPRPLAPSDTALRSRRLRLAFLTNVIAPYWKVIFDELSPRYSNLRIFLSTRMESNRLWDVDWRGLDVVLQKTITLNRRWHHPKGFEEPLYVHLPVDTLVQLRKYRPDVVISNEMGFRTCMAAIYRRFHPQSRLIVWAEIAQSTEQDRGRMREWLRRFVHQYVDGFVVLGESGARYIASLGVEARKIFRVPYTTDVRRFAECALKRREDQAYRLLYVGQLIERKGLLQFVRALSQWAAAHPNRDLEFVLAGTGPFQRALEMESVASNLKLTFRGNVSYADLPKLYATAGLFAFPTLADTWGVVINEALASGLPVLGSVYSQAVEELVESGRNGWLFRSDDFGEMYQAIDEALNTPIAILNEMREQARSEALKLTPARVADLIDDFVTRTIGAA